MSAIDRVKELLAEADFDKLYDIERKLNGDLKSAKVSCCDYSPATWCKHFEAARNAARNLRNLGFSRVNSGEWPAAEELVASQEALEICNSRVSRYFNSTLSDANKLAGLGTAREAARAALRLDSLAKAMEVRAS